MDYKAHYSRLIERARNRVLDGYSERHHIVPRCMKGTNAKSNLVDLTAEEHFVAHQLLVKIYPGNFRLVWSLGAMCGGSGKQKRNNKMYGWMRRKFADMIRERSTGKVFSEESRAKMSAARIGRKFGNYRKHENPSPLKGKPKSEAHRLALSKAKLGTKRGPHSLETRKKISDSNKIASGNRDLTWMKSERYKNLMSSITREIWARRKSGAPSMLMELHQ